jgi:hypothetical protein
MANEINGRDVYLILDDLKFANEQGLTNSETIDMLESTNKHSPNKRKTFIADESTGTITANGFYCITDPTGTAGYHALKAIAKAGTEISYELGNFATGGIIESGKCLINTITQNANRAELSTYDISLQKTGDWVEATYAS